MQQEITRRNNIVKISVIIPVYNVDKYIERSLRSIFEQTMTDEVEFIVVNDASTDCSIAIALKVIQEYTHLKDQIKVLNHTSNRGAAATRQTGLDNASGEYTIHLDSDDWCEPSMLEELFVAAKVTDSDIVVCDFWIDYGDRQLYKSQPAFNTGGQCVEQLLSGLLRGSLCNKLIKRALYVDHQIGFIEGVNLWEDLLVVIKLCSCSNRIVHLPKAFLHYMQVNVSSYTANMLPQSLASVERAVGMMERFLMEQGLMERYREAILYQKLAAKRLFIQHTRNSAQKRYAAYYPEADKVIWKHPSLPKHYKTALWTSRHSLLLTNIIFRALDTAKKVF